MRISETASEMGLPAAVEPLRPWCRRISESSSASRDEGVSLPPNQSHQRMSSDRSVAILQVEIELAVLKGARGVCREGEGEVIP